MVTFEISPGKPGTLVVKFKYSVFGWPEGGRSHAAKVLRHAFAIPVALLDENKE